MGTRCAIGRRLSPDYVQYGCGGPNGGFFTAGLYLLCEYDTPEAVEKLFRLGQLDLLGTPPDQESRSGWYKTRPSGMPHQVGQSERELFDCLWYLSFGYFYDSDHRWYLITVTDTMVKMPLDTMAKFFLEYQSSSCEFEYYNRLLEDAAQRVQDAVKEWRETDPDYARYLEQAGYDAETFRAALDSLDPKDIYESLLYHSCPHHKIMEYFHNLILIIPVQTEGTTTVKAFLQRAQDPYVETFHYQQQYASQTHQEEEK